ncbi:hypothetical protein CEXT_357641 [Caerostris extrusa]|uniref:Uncharacterized protein n=1 Tax=Caerostris extrusa TaxID=172846 RepID=A0AAV4NV52_CAEEX|nr:hypothetical protein CEXT_357641 [Caerostris extrusa]
MHTVNGVNAGLAQQMHLGYYRSTPTGHDPHLPGEATRWFHLVQPIWLEEPLHTKTTSEELGREIKSQHRNEPSYFLEIDNHHQLNFQINLQHTH